MMLPKITSAMLALLAATSPVHGMRRRMHQDDVCTEPVGQPCPPLEDVVSMITPATQSNGIEFTNVGTKSNPTAAFRFTNMFVSPGDNLNAVVLLDSASQDCSNADAGFRSFTDFPGGNTFETTTPLGELSPECDLTLSIYAQDEQYFMAEPSFESVGGCDGFLNKDVVPGVLGRCAQCNYENFQVSLPRNICLQPVRVAKDALPGNLLNKRLDNSLQSEAIEICEIGVIPPAVDDSACTSIEPDWIRLKTSFLRVDDTVTADQISEFAASQEVPEQTEAIGVFSGVCGLDEDFNKPVALIITFCGPPPTVDGSLPPPQDLPPSAPAGGTFAADEAPPVDTEPPAEAPVEDAPVDTGAAEALEAEATAVLGEALLG